MSASSSQAVRPSLPAQGTILKICRESCKAARLQADVKVDQSSIDRFLVNLDEETVTRLKTQHGLDLPIKFDDAHSEITFLTVLSVLNTLSAYRAPFHAVTGKGAYQNVIALCVGLYNRLGIEKFSASGLASLTRVEVLEQWRLASKSSETFEQDQILEPANLVIECCHSTGRALLANGYETPAALVLDALPNYHPEAEMDDPKTADDFVYKIISTIPAFYDAYLPSGASSKPIYLFKKAYFLLYSLYQAFHRSGQQQVPVYIPDLSRVKLPMFVDNVLPTMCLHLGLVDTSESTFETLSAWGKEIQQERQQKTTVVKGGPSLTAEEAYHIRAATLDAASIVIDRLQEVATQDEKFKWLLQISEVDLDGYLWAAAKDDPALRKVPRMVEQGTIMY
ncbi:unnamed protein product [Sympodiomycopsis kandeliae]